jgi:hypothetical protein
VTRLCNRLRRFVDAALQVLTSLAKKDPPVLTGVDLGLAVVAGVIKVTPRAAQAEELFKPASTCLGLTAAESLCTQQHQGPFQNRNLVPRPVANSLPGNLTN